MRLRWAFLLLILFTGCRTLSLPPEAVQSQSDARAVPVWVSLEEGLDFYSVRDNSIPLAVYVLRVDLGSELWELVFTPPVEGASFSGMKTSAFLGQTGCRAAINGGPFSPYRWFFSGEGQTSSGLYVWNDRPVSPPVEHFAALAVDTRGVVVIRSQSDYPFAGRYVLGGFQQILFDGEVTGAAESPVDARTAAGVSRDGRYLYFLVADGRRKGYSRGLNLEELGRFLRRLGAWNGLNLDGGGSSVMVIGMPEPRIINRPVNHRGFPERIVATHIGIRKKGVDD